MVLRDLQVDLIARLVPIMLLFLAVSLPRVVLELLLLFLHTVLVLFLSVLTVPSL